MSTGRLTVPTAPTWSPPSLDMPTREERGRGALTTPARRFIVASSALWLALAGASYLKSDWTRNDFERFDDLRLSFLFFVLIAALSAVYAELVQQSPRVSRRTALLAAAAWTILLIASFPVGSKDVFLYAAYGRIEVRYAENPYRVTPADLPGDQWDAYVQHRWRDQPAVYGPLFLAQARLIERVAGDRPWAVVWLHKALAGVLFLAAVGIAMRLRPASVPGAALVLFAWNPLLLFESGGAAHNDIAMLVLLLAAFACWARERWAAALALLALAFWYKWYALLFLPAFAIELWKSRDARAAIRCAAALGAAGAVCGAAVLVLLPGSAAAIVHQLLAPAVVQGIFPHEISPVLAGIFWPMRLAGVFDLPHGAAAFHAVRTALFALAAGAVLVRQARATRGLEPLMESCCLLGIAFFSLMVTMLFPWHLLAVVGIGLCCERRGVVLAAAAIGVLALLSYFLTFAVGALLLAAVGVAVWVLRRSDVHSPP
jgi:alpha-1,6-mannosyltransferase